MDEWTEVHYVLMDGCSMYLDCTIQCLNDQSDWSILGQ